MKTFIFAFDPGVKTGFIWYSIDKKEIVTSLILHGYKDINDELQLTTLDTIIPIVIYEKNVGKCITQEQFQMVKYCGFIEGFCIANNIECIGQTPSVRKGYIKKAKEYFESHYAKNDYEIHNIDAFAHVLRYLDKRRKIR